MSDGKILKNKIIESISNPEPRISLKLLLPSETIKKHLFQQV